jgi:transcriptional regulator with XRE-family HTH domain
MINDRIQLLINELFDGNKSKFAQKIGISGSHISNYLGNKRRSIPSFEMIEDIYKSIEGINPEWLLTGEGEWKKNLNSTVSDNQLTDYLSRKLDEKNIRIEELARQLGEKTKENELLHKRIIELDAINKYKLPEVAEKKETWKKEE